MWAVVGFVVFWGRPVLAVWRGRAAARRLLRAGGRWRRATLGVWCAGWAGLAVATVWGVVFRADLGNDAIGGSALLVAIVGGVLAFGLACGTALRVLFRTSYDGEVRDAWCVWLLLGAVIATPFVLVAVA